GVIYHWLGGFCSATNFIPFRGIKRWSWEIYWIIQGVAAWLIMPTLVASYLVPHLFDILRQAHRSPDASLAWPLIMGILWGVGGITFGLAIRYLGLGLGYAIALGFCTAFGTLVPPIYDGQLHAILHETSGLVTLAGVGLSLLAIAVSGAAGYSKEHEITAAEKAETGERDYSFVKGLGVAIFAGIMSAFFAFGLSAGKPLGDMTKVRLIASGRAELWQDLPIMILIMLGGLITNFIWSAVLIFQNKSIRQFGGEPAKTPWAPPPLPVRPSKPSILAACCYASTHLLWLRTICSPHSPESSGTSSSFSIRWAQPRWANMSSLAGRSTWRASSSLPHSGASPCMSGKAQANARGCL